MRLINTNPVELLCLDILFFNPIFSICNTKVDTYTHTYSHRGTQLYSRFICHGHKNINVELCHYPRSHYHTRTTLKDHQASADTLQPTHTPETIATLASFCALSQGKWLLPLLFVIRFRRNLNWPLHVCVCMDMCVLVSLRQTS